jgi:GH15 family glucan-1,4-alpha-glucosidase
MADGAGPPDDRGLQEDGPGWVLWAAFELLDSLESAEDRRAVLERLEALIDRSTDRILARLDPATGLPAPSSDYWEAPEERLTLGIAASALAGLEAAERLHEASGDASRERRSAAASTRLRIALHRAFASHAYPRYMQGADPDAAIAFLLPPFQPTALPGSELALGRAIPTDAPASRRYSAGRWVEERRDFLDAGDCFACGHGCGHR